VVVAIDPLEYDNMVSSIAYEYSRKFQICYVQDILQELCLWYLEHKENLSVMSHKDSRESDKLIARSLRNAAKDYCQREKARAVGYRVEDNYYYDREIVELLLPAVLRRDLNAPAMSELGFTKAKKVASEGGNWFAMMADIDKALSRLTQEQLTIVYLRFGDGCDNVTLAKELAITEDASRMRVNRAINNLLNFLGGSRPRKERDYTEEEVNEQKNEDTRSDEDIRELGLDSAEQGVD
jgi:RNA polymerase sigma factor (sigma-70 family)